MAFTQSWFTDDIPDNQTEGFSHLHLDSDASAGKTRGSGVCFYIMDSWSCRFANQINISICVSVVLLISAGLG